MHPRPLHRPTVQQGRLAGRAPEAPPPYTSERRVTPMPPEPNRFEQRRVVPDAWGRMSLAGNSTDRVVVQSPLQASRGGSTPILCGFAAFLLASYFAR